jgi:hypothetical protein
MQEIKEIYKHSLIQEKLLSLNNKILKVNLILLAKLLNNKLKKREIILLRFLIHNINQTT